MYVYTYVLYVGTCAWDVHIICVHLMDCVVFYGVIGVFVQAHIHFVFQSYFFQCEDP